MLYIRIYDKKKKKSLLNKYFNIGTYLPNK